MRRHLLAFTALSLVALPVFTDAASTGTPVVRGEKIRDFARITFEWPRSTYLNASADGNVLTVRFERRGAPVTGQVMKSLAPYVTKAEVIDGGKAMRFTLNRPYRVRSFVSGNVSGVDLLEVNATPLPAQKKQTAAAPKTTIPKKATASAARLAALAPAAGEPEKSAAAPEPAASPQAAAAPEATPTAETPTPVPAAETKSADTPPPAPAAEAKPAEVPAPAAPQPVAGAAPAAPDAETKPPTTTVTPAEAPPPSPAAETTPPAATPEAVPAPVETKTETKPASTEAAPDNGIRIFATNTSEGIQLRFPFRERTAAAVFQRGDKLWMVFSKPVKMDFAALKETTPEIVARLQTREENGVTVLQLLSVGGAGAGLSKGENNFDWNILLATPAPVPKERLSIEPDTKGPLPANVFIPALEISEPVTLQDPDIGDTLLVVPFFQASQAISPARSFIEFDLLATAQGIALQKKSDSVALTTIRNGIRISSPRGLILTPDLPTPTASVTMPPVDKTATLFPNDQWKAPPGKSFLAYETELKTQITNNTRPSELNNLRTRLAQFYLSEGMGVEALSVLQTIQREDNNFYIEHRLSALSGASRFLIHRFPEASQDFSVPELQGLPETNYWKSILADLLGASGQPLDYTEYASAYLNKYPPTLRQHIAIVAADRMAANNKPSESAEVIDSVKDTEIPEKTRDYFTFLQGRILVDSGKIAEGVALWKPLADNYANGYVRARAEFALIGEELRAKSIQPEEALNRLELLRLSWRGDNLEQNVLVLLADIYNDRKEYPLALRAWRDITTIFPGTSQALESQSRMRTAFLELFDKNYVENFPPLDQLALYYEFKDLLPSDASGTRILEKLADRLVSLDLLDQAAGLLDQRMRYVYERSERSRVGAKLAQVYLLNRHPEKSIEALQASVYGDNPEELRTERDRLAAEAMIELAQYENAFELLKSDKSPAAEEARLEIHWRKKDWPKVIASLETLMKARPVPTQAMNAKEGEHLVKLALAYAATRDMSQIQYLRDYFLPLMQNNPREELFAFVTSPEAPVTPEKFDEVVAQLEATRTFLSKYEIAPAELAEMRPASGNATP